MKKQVLQWVAGAWFVVAGFTSLYAQTYNWTGAQGSNFYGTGNWTSTDGPVVFDNSSFKVVRTHAAGSTPAINQFVDWQPGIFDATGGNLIINADFNVFFNDWLNGNITVNSGATFTCRNIIRVGREGAGTVNLYGTMQAANVGTWQGIFIGALAGGNGTVNVHQGGVLNGGYQVEVGSRNNYPTGVLNVYEGATSQAYWNTVIGPNGTINVNGGTVNCGQGLIIGDLYVDTPGTEGTLGATVGTLNINAGTVTVNQNDLDAPFLGLHANSKVTLDNGMLRIMRTGVDFTPNINAAVNNGQIVAAAGKEISVVYDGVYTTVTAEQVFAVKQSDKHAFVVYPNPTSDYLNIQNDGTLTYATILDLQGRSIASEQNTNRVDVSGLPNGVYFVKLRSDNAQSTLKFVKQ